MTSEMLLALRQQSHGDFQSTAALTQQLKATFHLAPNWTSMPSDQREALEMLAAKIARILCGDPMHEDHWRDMAGYSMLVVQIIQSFYTVKSDDNGAPVERTTQEPPL